MDAWLARELRPVIARLMKLSRRELAREAVRMRRDLDAMARRRRVVRRVK